MHVWRTVEILMCQRAGRRENDFAAGTVAPLTQEVASLNAVIPNGRSKKCCCGILGSRRSRSLAAHTGSTDRSTVPSPALHGA
jgi:hypothetical protein